MALLLDVQVFLILHSVMYPFAKDLMDDQVNLFLKHLSNEMNDVYQISMQTVVEKYPLVVAWEVLVVKKNLVEIADLVVKIVEVLEKLD